MLGLKLATQTLILVPSNRSLMFVSTSKTSIMMSHCVTISYSFNTVTVELFSVFIICSYYITFTEHLPKKMCSAMMLSSFAGVLAFDQRILLKSYKRELFKKVIDEFKRLSHNHSKVIYLL
jgi:hypothetical protein